MTQHRDSIIARADRVGGPTSFLLQSWVVCVLIAAVVVVLALAMASLLT